MCGFALPLQELKLTLADTRLTKLYVQEVDHDEVRVVFAGRKHKNFHVRSKHTFGHLLLSCARCVNSGRCLHPPWARPLTASVRAWPCRYYNVDPQTHALIDEDGCCWPATALVLPSLRAVAQASLTSSPHRTLPVPDDGWVPDATVSYRVFLVQIPGTVKELLAEYGPPQAASTLAHGSEGHGQDVVPQAHAAPASVAPFATDSSGAHDKLVSATQSPARQLATAKFVETVAHDLARVALAGPDEPSILDISAYSASGAFCHVTAFSCTAVAEMCPAHALWYVTLLLPGCSLPPS